MLIIPSQIVEISITPNSFSILLMLILLILCVEPVELMHNTQKRKNVKPTIILLFTVLVISHPINAGILLSMLIIFYIGEYLLKIKKYFISLKELFLFICIWGFWLVFLTMTGNSLIKVLSKMISGNSFGLEMGIRYSVGNTGFIYPLIDQLSAMKYSLYGLFTLFIILYIISLHLSNLNGPADISVLPFLIISGFLTLLTFFNLIFGGFDIQNIISRTMNFAMYSLCTFIAFFIPAIIISKTKATKFMKILFVLILSFSLLTYPIYSFARDAYINYPQSEENGRLFSENYFLNEKRQIIEISKSEGFYLFMYGKISFEKLMTRNMKIFNDNKYYSNDWYIIGERVE
ncbi:hypothetical protein [Methanospirillum sp.]|jgi:hypothetical protein|uniref:hypothetical protein n=1 Tax=Methanospirillum sp. TaxID=45200 RepID=UPI001BD59062|nr:hypothetical protein [Methanospirillum sp.]